MDPDIVPGINYVSTLFPPVDMNAICDPNNPDYDLAKSIHQFHVRNSKGEYVKLDIYKGHVCIIVNIATQSKFSAVQVNQLNELYDRYGEEKGLRILAFPCNQFGNEEPGSTDDITEFASLNNIKFDLYEKVDVNGDTSSDLCSFLKNTVGVANRGGEYHVIKWSYNKFIVTKAGVPVERYGSEVEPLSMVGALEKYW